MARTDIVKLPKKWPSENWESTWVPGVRVGNIVYISGITASDINGQPVGLGDFKVQAERCLDKLRDVLGRVGGTMDDVVKLTTYLTPEARPEAVRAYFDIRAAYFGASGPASSGVTVHSLLRKEYLLEIDAIAHLKEV
jgi:enamine deaminase RidA (YjgF/YER057c/UK114 family)